jgi:uncharacterized membrane protein
MVSISEIKRKARFALRGQWGIAVLLTFLVILINSVLPTIIEMIFSGGVNNWLRQETVSPSASFASLLVSIALLPLSATVLWFYLSVSRFERPQISDVFAIFTKGKLYFKLIGAYLVIAIFIILWSILFIIPGIIKSLSYSQTFFLLKDHPEYTILQAITESRKRMDGLKWKYFLLNLSFIGWAFLSIFTLGIGYLWLAPYITTSTAVFYNELVHSQERTLS